MLKLRNIEEFSNEIERLVKEKHLSYIEAVVEHTDALGLEYDACKLKSLISPKIKKRLHREAVKLNMFPKKKKRKKTIDKKPK